MTDKNKIILVTGATGFIGSYIVRKLVQQGFRNIYAMHRQQSEFYLLGSAVESVQWIKGSLHDLEEADAIADQIDVVVHCAGLVSMNRYHWNQLVHTNIHGTSNIVNFCLEKKIPELIHISSASALGKFKDGNYIDENAVWQQAPLTSLYAKSKYLSELEVFRGKAEGLTATVINPPFVVGGGWWNGGTMSILSRIDKGLSYYPSGTNGVVDVRDVASLVSILIGENIRFDRIICCAQSVSHLDLATAIADSLNCQPPHRPVGRLISLGMKFMDPFVSLFRGNSPATAQGLYLASQDFKYDNSLSLSIPGFAYRSVDETVESTCEAYKKSIADGTDFGILPI